MIERWVLEVSLGLVVLSVLLYVVILNEQRKAFRKRSTLQPLKWLLFGAVFLLILGAAPLGLEYANILWWHNFNAWTVNTAVLLNALAKLVVGLLLYRIYKYRGGDDDLYK